MDGETKEVEPNEATGNLGWSVISLEKLKSPPETLAASVYVCGFLFVAAALGIGVWAFFFFGYEMFTGEIKDRTEAAKVFFPVLVALFGGPLLIWRVISGHWTAVAAKKQAQIAQETHYTSLFTTAVEQLGSTRERKTTREINSRLETTVDTEANLEIRLGAIYALERIARDSSRDHWPIMEVLCAYIRNAQNTGPPVPLRDGLTAGTRAFDDWWKSLPRCRVDVQAVIKVLGRRPKERKATESEQSASLDLSKANLQRAVFDGGDFSDATLMESYLNGCYFQYSNFQNASFDLAHLEGAIVDDADLRGASFMKAVFDGTGFAGSKLDRADFRYAILKRVAFSGASLTGANFEGARFYDTNFDHADLSSANFFEADLSRIKNITTEALAETLGDLSTKLPNGLERPKNWSDGVLNREERDEYLKASRERASQA